MLMAVRKQMRGCKTHPLGLTEIQNTVETLNLHTHLFPHFQALGSNVLVCLCQDICLGVGEQAESHLACFYKGL